LVPRRKMIRKAINEAFYELIHESHKFNGAAELLDILASIISGFAVPLREEHVTFFKNVIIPLHKVQTCGQFYEQLLRCSMLFLTKDRSLAISLLDGLLRYWPYANCIKETLFLAELQEVLEVCENDYFLNILKSYKEKTFPMLVPVIVDLADNHWHKILQESLIALKTILKEIDPFAFEEAQTMDLAKRKLYSVKQDEDDRNAFDKKWEKLNTKLS
jgi:serine/threonine-protein phosphatase 2A regulatory subunit B'